MEQNTKTILLAVLILLIAIVSFNFTGITGEAVTNKATVKIISPANKEVHRGETIRVNVIPGDNTVDNDIWIYKEISNMRMSLTQKDVCGRYGNQCDASSIVVFDTLDTDNSVKWSEGKYSIRVEEHNGNYIAKDIFTLVE